MLNPSGTLSQMLGRSLYVGQTLRHCLEAESTFLFWCTMCCKFLPLLSPAAIRGCAAGVCWHIEGIQD